MPQPTTSPNWLELCRWASDRSDKRRSYQWKITLGFWAVLLASTTGHVDFQPAAISAAWWALVWLGFTFLWLRGTWVASENDKNRAEEYLKLATGRKTEHVDPPKIHPSQWRFWFGFLPTWAAPFQSLATAGIILAISKGTRSKLGCPRSLIDFWWGKYLFVTWGLLTVVAIVGLWLAWRLCIWWRKARKT